MMNFRCRVLSACLRKTAFLTGPKPYAPWAAANWRRNFTSGPGPGPLNDLSKSAPPDPSPPPADSRLPPISDLPHILWPSFVKTIKNFILSTFVIRPYLDQDFYASEFMRGAKQALVAVSDVMSDGKFEELSGLVTPECLKTVKERVGCMSIQNRTSLRVLETDIYLAFPYQIGMIIYDETSGIQKRFVEITVAYHVFRGLKDLLDSGTMPRDPLRSPEHSKNIMVCNYRFIREYTKDVADSWTVNKLTHFRPADWM